MKSLLDTILLGVGLLYAFIIPPTLTSFLSGAFQSINFTPAYGIFMYPISVVEHFYSTNSSYPFVLVLILAWVSLPELAFLAVLLRRHAKKPARALLVFYVINLAAGALLL
ncbi:MAG: hypothetical protein LYZ66_01765, partial [Nitrososphaerales archaeon]|nr:hypothetical protein [Nitrososphaerales archaeon]